MKRTFAFGGGTPPVCRLGFAARPGNHLRPEDVRYAVERGVNYFNWCGTPSGMSRGIAEMGAQRERVVVATQLVTTAKPASAALGTLDQQLRELGTDYLDIVTFHYVESERKWLDIVGEDGAYEAMLKAREEGKVRMFGMTSHQRKLAVRIAEGKLGSPPVKRPLDILMLRYSAAHRGAEREVFPVTDALGIPVVVYTCLRWGALLRPTRDDPPGYVPPPAKEWYRFALANPSVAVALMAPDNQDELEENLAILDDWREPTPEEYASLVAHGERVYRHAGAFP